MDAARSKVLVYPAYGLAFSVAVIGLIKLVELPAIIRNPLMPARSVEVRYRFLRTFLRPHFVVSSMAMGGVVGFIQYEVIKYFEFLRYEKLVSHYLEQVQGMYNVQIRQQSLEAEE